MHSRPDCNLPMAGSAEYNLHSDHDNMCVKLLTVGMPCLSFFHSLQFCLSSQIRHYLSLAERKADSGTAGFHNVRYFRSFNISPNSVQPITKPSTVSQHRAVKNPLAEAAL